MAIKHPIFGIYFLVIFLLYSCGGKEEVAITDDHPQEKNIWADSIFGQLTEEEQYNQHIIVDIPKLYEQNLDSLIGWINDKQPGGLHFIDWDIDSIYRVRSTIDTTLLIKPFIYTSFYETLNLPEYRYWMASKANQKKDLMKVFSGAGFNLLHFGSSIDLNVLLIG